MRANIVFYTSGFTITHDEVIGKESACMRTHARVVAICAGVMAIVGLLALSACGVSGSGNTPVGAAVTNGSQNGSPAATIPPATVSPGPNLPPGPPAGNSSAALSCVLRMAASHSTLERVTVSCAVRGAASNQTSFVLLYSVRSSKGFTVAEPGMTCRGTLSNGAGACTIAFDEDPVSANPGTVVGYLLPSHQHIGPATPTRAS
jgi:hypothetical protein